MILDDATLIDKYIRDELTSVEQGQFEERKLDDAFMSQLNSMEALKETITHQGQIRMKEMLKGLEVEVDQKKRSVNNTKRFLWALLAVLALCLFYFSSQRPSSSSNQNLYAAHYVPYPNIEDPITKGESMEGELSVSQLYEMNRLEDAIYVFENQESLSTADSFYVGVSYLAIGEGQKSEDILKDLVNPNVPYSKPSEYYLSLAYLRNMKLTEGTLLLESIKGREDHPFQQKAGNLLEEVVNLKK